MRRQLRVAAEFARLASIMIEEAGDCARVEILDRQSRDVSATALSGELEQASEHRGRREWYDSLPLSGVADTR